MFYKYENCLSDTYNDFELEVFTDRKEIYCMELKKYVDHYKKAIKFCISHFTMIELDSKLQENISIFRFIIILG